MDYLEGIMNYDADISLGFDVRQFMPLNISAWDVAGNVLADWCRGWMGNDFAPPLTPVGWLRKDTILASIFGPLPRQGR